MTLMEMLVGLSVLGLAMGFALATLGPWLLESRRTDREAAFWRSVEPAQLILTEFAAGIVDPEETFSLEADRARLRVFVPRLAPAPFDAELAIVARENERNALLIRAPALEPREGVLLDDAPPLRFRRVEPREGVAAIVLEAQSARNWTPILMAPVATDAPLHCEFDFIARACR